VTVEVADENFLAVALAANWDIFGTVDRTVLPRPRK